MYVGGVNKPTPKPFNIFLTQATSATMCAKALYLASVELPKTEFCFLDCQEIGLFPKNTTYPVTNLLLLRSAA